MTRWHIQRQRITDEITALEAKLVQVQAEQQSPGSAVEIEKQLASLHTKLRMLGPCPKPMMG